MIGSMYYSQGRQPYMAGAADTKMYGRQEYMTRERQAEANGVRPPRRSQTTYNYVYPMPPPLVRGESRTVLVQQQQQHSSAGCAPALASSTADEVPRRPPAMDEEVKKQKRHAAASATARAAATAAAEASRPPARPKLGAPRRSYSVMDYEPVPPTQQPSPNLALSDLPPELHYAIFDFLDPIDSTCLGLTNKHFYAIHRRMHGTVPLSVRRAGPNDMEVVWYLAGRMVLSGKPEAEARAAAVAATANATTAVTPATTTATTKTVPKAKTTPTATATNALAKMRVRGQALCRKCGVERCELHKHIQDWMGPGYEYCTVREKFGPTAPAGAKEFCYLSNPKDPHRCGRHRVPKSRPTTPEHKQ